MKDGRATARSLSLIGAAARGPAEQFYLPREVLDLVRERWEPAHTELLLAPLREAERVQQRPAVREKRPGPNQPCACGSGKKYKKCCGSPNRRAPQD